MVWESVSKMHSSLLVPVSHVGYWESGRDLEISYWNCFSSLGSQMLFKIRIPYPLLAPSFELTSVRKRVSIVLLFKICNDWIPYEFFQNFRWIWWHFFIILPVPSNIYRALSIRELSWKSLVPCLLVIQQLKCRRQEEVCWLNSLTSSIFSCLSHV